MSVIDSRVGNLDQLKLEHFQKGDKFESDAVKIGPLPGAEDLGYANTLIGRRSVLSAEVCAT